MYSCLVARERGEDEYQMFTYAGKSIDVPFRGITRTMEKGQRFGVRKSSSGKQIRMIFAGDPARVMTINASLAQRIAKGIKGG